MSVSIKKSFTVLLLLQFVFSCSTKKEEVEIPPNIIGEELFTKILVDFALAESASNLNIKNVPNQRFDTVYAFNPLSENHITKSRYDSTVLFYANNTTLYKKIYENVLANLSEIQTKRDSLRNDSVPK